MTRRSIAHELGAVVELYRAARSLGAEEFPEHALAWLCRRVPFDQGFFVTSLVRATWVDAHFYNVPDPRALMASHAAVQHLDLPSARMLARPFEVQRIDYESEELGAPRFAPLREHLRRFDAMHTLMVAIPSLDDGLRTAMVLVRGERSRPFAERQRKLFGALAPHVGEANHVNRARFLPREPGARSADRAVALVSPDGMLKATSPDFAQLLWPDDPARTAYLPEPMLRLLRQGRACPLSSGKHSLYAEEQSPGGWLLRVRESGPVDQLSPREREVALRFARGQTHKLIAEKLAVSPVTVRNHLQNIYAKLGVSAREELSLMLRLA